MRTKASIKGHAIHQMLIPFPIGLLFGAFIFDILGYIFDTSALWQTGYYITIAGVIMGLAAGVFGFIDYLFSVPPQSTGRQRATRHLVLMLMSIAFFFISWLLRDNINESPGLLTLLLELLGAVTLSIGGWMGGTLVSRNFIGPDHRYAYSGKWKEATLNGKKGESIEVAKSNELQVNQMKLIRINGERIVLARTEEGYMAFQDRCTHRGGSLADGVLICNTVQCLWHGSQFDTRNGKVKAGPAKEEIRTFPVIEQEDKIMLKLDI